VTSELRVTLRIRNNRLIAAREVLGLGARAAAKAIGVSYARLLQYEALKWSPVGANGTWRPQAVRIAAFYGGSCGMYWPEAVLAIVEPVRTVEIDALDVARLEGRGVPLVLMQDSANPEGDMADSEKRALLTAALMRFPRRSVEVTLSYIDGDTAEEVGLRHGISRSRVTQIVEKVLRGLRHPKISRTLRPFIEAETVE
jgi:hypothetical protein